MTVKTAKQAENNFNELIEEVTISKHPIVISGEKYNAVLISQEQWSSIQETLYVSQNSSLMEQITQSQLTHHQGKGYKLNQGELDEILSF